MANGEYGLKIRKYSAAILYELNSGVREYGTYTDAMLNNSMFLFFMKEHGLHVYNNESTRDVICLDFDFGTKSYAGEVKRVKKLLYNAKDEDMEKIKSILERVERHKDQYKQISREELRKIIYTDGIDVTYKNYDKAEKKEVTETIHYKYLFRTPAKAKLGQAMFINEELYDVAYNWLTMGVGHKMPEHNAKIVEMSAYAPLTTSSITGLFHMPVENLVIVKDQDSVFRTMVDVVYAEEYYDQNNEIQKRCAVKTEERDVVNTLWDGMGLIESSCMPDDSNGMLLLRNHFFKMCGFRTHIQLFFKDWCEKTGNDYDTYEVADIFGLKHRLKDIKIITTENAVKWYKKFWDIMGNDKLEAYEYWKSKIRENGNNWGIVKTDHPSKLGKYQQMSYQMVNSLPCTKSDIENIIQTSAEYITKLKNDVDVFEAFLRKNANISNHYEMLADLLKWNRDIWKCNWFKKEKRAIIFAYVEKLRTGKIFVNADNLTLCGNPYALLLYVVGEDWNKDQSLQFEKDCIQCYTKRFADGEYLAGFRSPHNSPNNIVYFHNHYSDEMERYFKFSPNIIAVNCIKTTVESRLNGSDFDSDFCFVTNQQDIVRCAKTAFTNYRTIVNALKESGIFYNNTLEDYAKMDNNLSKSRLGIGWSSNLAQLALSYYYTNISNGLSEDTDQDTKQLYNVFIILSVLA